MAGQAGRRGTARTLAKPTRPSCHARHARMRRMSNKPCRPPARGSRIMMPWHTLGARLAGAGAGSICFEELLRRIASKDCRRQCWPRWPIIRMQRDQALEAAALRAQPPSLRSAPHARTQKGKPVLHAGPLCCAVPGQSKPCPPCPLDDEGVIQSEFDSGP